MDTDNIHTDVYNNKFRDIDEARNKYKICLSENFEVISYVPITPLLQQGPQCGLVALGMVLNAICQEHSIEELFGKAKSLGYTLNGEIFSSLEFFQFISLYLEETKIHFHRGQVDDEKCLKHLESNGIILVPYDADGNHSPSHKKGHKAHWAVINGLLKSNDQFFVTARHGKSKHLAIWRLDELSSSNSQLEEFSPSRDKSDLVYVIPQGGLGGFFGLKNTCILINI